MTNSPHNPARPNMPDEADLLAWVEGESLPRERELAVARALQQDRKLARRLEAMRADRLALRALREPECPADVLAGVESALQPVLERQMLLGLSQGAPIEDHLPVSIVRPVKRSILQAF